MTFEEWLRIPEGERCEIARAWNVYSGEGADIVRAAAEQFARQVAGQSDVKVTHGVYHGGDWIIAVTTPFVFDKRRIPAHFLGIWVRQSTADLPREFLIRNRSTEYVWAPERYEAFVDRAADEVRATLGNPDMSRKHMLDALSGEDFDVFKERCRAWEREGKIPPYRDVSK